MPFIKKSVVTFVVTFVCFFIEALIHYNLGKDEKKFVWPPPKDLCKLIVTILSFSFLSTVIIAFISKKFLKKKKT